MKRRAFAICIALVASALSGGQAEVPWEERDIEIRTDLGELKGTWTSPIGEPTAVALVIGGSGPIDRYGNAPPAIQGDTYRAIARDLATRRIAVLSVDKRGVGASGLGVGAELDLTIDRFERDVRAEVQYLRTQTGKTCVWLIGHSEGALIAELAAVNGASVCGLVLLAPMGRRPAEVLREQLRARLSPELFQSASRALFDLEAGRDTDCPQPLFRLCRASVQPFLRSLLRADPALLMEQIEVPVLVLRGSEDLQVSAEDARALGQANPDVETRELPAVNHVLKAVPNTPNGNLTSYGDPMLSAAPAVSKAAADFILQNHRG